MSILLGVLATGRRRKEVRFTETVSVGIEVEETDANNNVVTRIGDEHYAGRAQIKYVSTVVAERTQAAQTVAVQRPELHKPVGPIVVFEGDYVYVTDSTSDPGLVGRKYRVSGMPESGQVTAHRYPLTEVT